MVKWPERDRPYFDLKPTVIPDFFTDEQYKEMYKLIEEYSWVPDQLNKPMGYFARNIYMKKELFDVMLKHVNKYYNVDAEMEDCMFIYNKYTWDTGFPPTLKPHFDTVADTGTITLTIILDNTIDWNIFVEDQEFEIQKNQALMFSGTHHLHWRPKIEFDKKDYYDFFLCHFIEKDSKTKIQLDDKYWDEMVHNRAEKSTDWWRQYESGQVQQP